jgi:hypothetical protein
MSADRRPACQHCGTRTVTGAVGRGRLDRPLLLRGNWLRDIEVATKQRPVAALAAVSKINILMLHNAYAIILALATDSSAGNASDTSLWPVPAGTQTDAGDRRPRRDLQSPQPV